MVDLLVSLCFHYCTKPTVLPESLPTWDLLRGFRRCPGTLASHEALATRLNGIGTDLKRDIRPGDRIRVLQLSCGSSLPVRAERKVEKVSEDWLEVDSPFPFELDGSELLLYVLSQVPKS